MYKCADFQHTQVIGYVWKYDPKKIQGKGNFCYSNIYSFNTYCLKP